MGRRMQRLQVNEPNDAMGEILPPTFNPLCQLFSLRALVDLGGMHGVVHKDHCSAPQLLAFLGVDLRLDSGDFDQDSIGAQLRACHRAVSEQNPDLPQDSPLLRNARWLQLQVGLSDTEMRLMMLCVLGRQHLALGQALASMGNLSGLRLTSVVATLLGAPMAEANRALSADSALARSGLVRVDEYGVYDFRERLDLLEGLEHRLLLPQESPFNLFADNCVLAPAATLQVDCFEHLQPRLEHIVQYLRHALQQRRTGVNVLIWGPPGTGKTEVVRTLSAAVNAELFEVSVSTRSGRRIEGMHRVSAYTLSQQILAQRGKALILFDEIEDIGGGDSDDDDDFQVLSRSPHSGHKAWMNRMLETNPVPAIWVSNRIGRIDAAHLRRFDYHLEMDTPPAAVRARMIAYAAGPLGVSDAWCQQMAANDHLGPALVARTTSVAGAMRDAGVTTPAEALIEELIEASLCAQRLAPCSKARTDAKLRYRVDAVNADCDLAALVDGLRHHSQARLCLYGPPGTGKSAFAQHLAEQLGLPAMLQRASDIFSAYVGETERKMAAMFRRAAQSKAVLILDEADSFLMSRQGARQRWEISCVNEMLTQMEAFEGIFIATTNLLGQLDDASMRRFDAKIALDYLRPDQIRALLLEACAALGIEPAGWEAETGQLHALTPGDFTTVIRQARFQPVRHLADLTGRLLDEVRLKKGGNGRQIGFGLPATVRTEGICGPGHRTCDAGH